MSEDLLMRGDMLATVAYFEKESEAKKMQADCLLVIGRMLSNVISTLKPAKDGIDPKTRKFIEGRGINLDTYYVFDNTDLMENLKQYEEAYDHISTSSKGYDAPYDSCIQKMIQNILDTGYSEQEDPMVQLHDISKFSIANRLSNEVEWNENSR